jgi:hypothetical protein
MTGGNIEIAETRENIVAIIRRAILLKVKTQKAIEDTGPRVQ